MTADIYKAAGIIVENRRLLVGKDFDKEFFVSPGGKVEKGENSVKALVRELQEELNILVSKKDLEIFGHFDAPASGSEERIVHMDIFVVKNFKGKIQNSREVEKLLWISSKIPEGIKVGSIFEHEVIPRLKASDLID